MEVGLRFYWCLNAPPAESLLAPTAIDIASPDELVNLREDLYDGCPEETAVVYRLLHPLSIIPQDAYGNPEMSFGGKAAGSKADIEQLPPFSSPALQKESSTENVAKKLVERKWFDWYEKGWGGGEAVFLSADVGDSRRKYSPCPSVPRPTSIHCSSILAPKEQNKLEEHEAALSFEIFLSLCFSLRRILWDKGHLVLVTMATVKRMCRQERETCHPWETGTANSVKGTIQAVSNGVHG
ncbi:hypothetical protein L345_07812, partial [Ophiophagus hannah]